MNPDAEHRCTQMKRKRNVDPILLDTPLKRGKVDKSWSAYNQDTPRNPARFKKKIVVASFAHRQSPDLNQTL